MPLTRIDSAFLDLDAIGGIDFDVQSGVPTLSVDATTHRVGIGTDVPIRDLSVYNDSNTGIEIKSGTTGQSSVFFTDTADANIGMIGYYHTDDSMFFRTNDEERVRITSTGNVGIGTDNPGDSRLFIDRQYNSTYATNAYNDDFLLIKNNSTTDGTAASIYMLVTGSGNSAAVGTINLIHTNNGSGALSFQTRNNGSMIEAVRIASSGNVGIGTDDPSNKLHLNGESYFYHSSGNSATYEFVGNHYAHIKITGDKDASAGGPYYNYVVTNGNNGTLEFRNNTTANLKVTYNGVVQIGGDVEDAANDIDASNTKLTIKQSGMGLEDGIYLERPNERRGHYIRVATSGNAQDALVFGTNQFGTETDHLLALDRGGNVTMMAGNVGIGTDNPGYKLSVWGDLDVYGAGSRITRIPNGGRQDTGNNLGAWWKVGTWKGAPMSSRIKLTVIGTQSYSNSLNTAGETVIYMVVDNANSIEGSFHGFTAGPNTVNYVAHKYNSSTDECEVWLKYNSTYASVAVFADVTDGWWDPENTNAGTTQPTGSALLGTRYSLTTQGASRLNVDSAGNVGIGTDNPAAKLEVNGGDARFGRSGLSILVRNSIANTSGATFPATFVACTTDGGSNTALVYWNQNYGSNQNQGCLGAVTATDTIVAPSTSVSYGCTIYGVVGRY